MPPDGDVVCLVQSGVHLDGCQGTRSLQATEGREQFQVNVTRGVQRVVLDPDTSTSTTRGSRPGPSEDKCTGRS